jgi:hypothetical protein
VADVIRPESAEVPRTACDHGAEGFRQVEHDKEAAALLGRLLGPFSLPLLRAVCGHHGVLPWSDEPDS